MADQDQDIEASELEVVEQQDAAAAQATDDDVPEEFRALSKADLAGMLKHTRKELGKQNAEVGEIRKLADELIRSQLKQSPAEPIKEVDFFENPQEAIRQAVENNPRVVAAESYAIQAQKAQRQQRLMQLHPDFGNIVRDPDFGKWVTSSGIRKELFQRAEAYDIEAAHELLSTFKQLKPQQAQHAPVSDEEKQTRQRSMQAASVSTGGSGESGKKVYRRSALIELQIRNPSKFASMKSEIDRAYAEGRVK